MVPSCSFSGFKNQKFPPLPPSNQNVSEQKVQMSSHRSLFDKPKQGLTCFRDFQEKETLPLEIEKMLFQKKTQVKPSWAER